MSVTDIIALIWLVLGGVMLMAWAQLTPAQMIALMTWVGVYTILMLGLPS